MDASHLLVGGMTVAAFLFLVMVERHSRRRAKQASADADRTE